MYEPLIQYINSFSDTPLTETEIEVVKSKVFPKKIRKKQYLLQEGEVCKHMAFVVKGAMRQYSVDDKGFEHIIRLSVENWWAGDRDSFTMLTPSLYNVDAWEDTDVLLITKADMYLLNEIPTISQMTRTLDERYFIATQNRLHSLISLSAEQRYNNLLNAYPAFIQRFPQHLIASYLGITKETLSRLRKNVLK